MTHTPGPWCWYAEDNSTAILCGYTENGMPDPFYHHVMAVSPCGACQERLEKGASWTWNRCVTPTADDANLIAAAPDMLEALRDVESKIVDFEAGRINWRPDDFLHRVRAAIAKAQP